MSEWIEWAGGEKPVGNQDKVNILFANGNTQTGFGCDFSWLHRNNGSGWDIVGYKLEDFKDLRDESLVRTAFSDPQNCSTLGNISEESLSQLKDRKEASSYTVSVGEESVDHYDLEDAQRVGKTYQVGDSALEHARKKLRAPGERGSKDRLTDIKEAKRSLERAIEQIEKHEALQK